MADRSARPELLRTSLGDLPLQDYRLRLAGREWSILHSHAILSYGDEDAYLGDKDRLPYGVVLWPAAIALAHDVAGRQEGFRGARVLELGAGTGLPGIVAASMGADVLQTDRQEVALAVCRGNALRNAVTTIAHRLADWSTWDDAARYDWILGSDILYAESMHEHLWRIFSQNLAAGGRILLADPFRQKSMPLLERLEAAGWAISMSKWSLGAGAPGRPVGVFELCPP